MAMKNEARGTSRLSWIYGDSWSRFFNLLPTAGLAGLFAGAMTLTIWLRWPPTVLASIGVGMATVGAFYEAFVAGMVTADVWRAGIRQGALSPEEAAYYEELARYIDAVGKGGRLPGALGRASASWALYYGMMVGAVPFTLFLFSYLEWLALLAFLGVITPLALFAFVSHKRWLVRVSEDARRRGFRLAELQEAMKRARTAE